MIYRTRKLNERVNALSRKDEDVTTTEKAMHLQRTQIIIPCSRINQAIIEDFSLVLILVSIEVKEPEREPYNNIQLISKILKENKTSLNLKEYQILARNESETTWKLRDGLLLRKGKFFVLNGQFTEVIPLRIAIIKEAYDLPLSDYPGKAKLIQLIKTRYY